LLPVLAYAQEQVRYHALVQQLLERHIPFEERALFSKYGGFGSSIHIFIPAASQNPPETAFVLAVPLSGAGAFAFEAALDFAEAAYAQFHSLPIDVRIAFLGDEPSSLPSDMTENAHTGLQDLYELLPYPEQTALWYLYMKDKPQRLNFVQGASGIVTPLQMLQNLPALCQRHAVPYVFPMTSNELFHLELADGPEVYAFSKTRGINTLVIMDEENGGNSAGISTGTLEASVLADMLLDYVSQLDLSSDPDIHYIMIPNVDGKIRFISGLDFIVVLIIGVALLMATFLVVTITRRRMAATRWHIFLCYSWIILLNLALLMSALGLVHLFLFTIGENLSPNNITALLLIAAGILLYFLFFLIPDGIKIPGKPNFYGYAAIIIGLLDTLIMISFNIILIPLCAGAFVFIIIGALWKNAIICYLAGLMIPLQAFGFFYHLFNNGNSSFSEFIISKNIMNILAVSIFLLPLLFIFRRGRLLLQKRILPIRRRKIGIFNRTQKSSRLFIPAAIFIVLFTATVQLLAFSVQRSTKPAADGPVRRIVEENGDTGEALAIYCHERLFLTRCILELDIDAARNPVRFDVFLQSDDESVPVIYSAVFENGYMPYRQDETRQNRIDFILGENPPNPFSFTLVVPAGFSGILNVGALYNSYDAAIDKQGKLETEDYILTVSRSIVIANNTH
jgi:hypothetical protein